MHGPRRHVMLARPFYLEISMSSLRGSLLIGAILVASAALGADEHRALVSRDGGRFELAWSKNWTQLKDGEVTGSGVAFEVQGNPQAMRVLLTPGPVREPDALSEAGLRFFIGKMIESLAPQAVESPLEAQPLTGGRQPGFFVHATDKAPKPGEYKYVNAIVVAAGDAPVIVTVLFNDAGAKDAALVRAAMANLSYKSP
jgi:hypothetical protein